MARIAGKGEHRSRRSGLFRLDANGRAMARPYRTGCTIRRAGKIIGENNQLGLLYHRII
jgi:hypothetical protein